MLSLWASHQNTCTISRTMPHTCIFWHFFGGGNFFGFLRGAWGYGKIDGNWGTAHHFPVMDFYWFSIVSMRVIDRWGVLSSLVVGVALPSALHHPRHSCPPFFVLGCISAVAGFLQSRFSSSLQALEERCHPMLESGNMASQRFCLRWNNHQSNLLSVFDQLLQVCLWNYYNSRNC